MPRRRPSRPTHRFQTVSGSSTPRRARTSQRGRVHVPGVRAIDGERLERILRKTRP
jgi:hypothetical protein